MCESLLTFVLPIVDVGSSDRARKLPAEDTAEALDLELPANEADRRAPFVSALDDAEVSLLPSLNPKVGQPN